MMANERKDERSGRVDFKQAEQAFDTIVQTLSDDYGKWVKSEMDTDAFQQQVNILKMFFMSILEDIQKGDLGIAREKLAFFEKKRTKAMCLLADGSPNKGKIIENLHAKRDQAVKLRKIFSEAIPGLSFWASAVKGSTVFQKTNKAVLQCSHLKEFLEKGIPVRKLAELNAQVDEKYASELSGSPDGIDATLAQVIYQEARNGQEGWAYSQELLNQLAAIHADRIMKDLYLASRIPELIEARFATREQLEPKYKEARQKVAEAQAAKAVLEVADKEATRLQTTLLQPAREAWRKARKQQEEWSQMIAKARKEEEVLRNKAPTDAEWVRTSLEEKEAFGVMEAAKAVEEEKRKEMEIAKAAMLEVQPQMEEAAAAAPVAAPVSVSASDAPKKSALGQVWKSLTEKKPTPTKQEPLLQQEPALSEKADIKVTKAAFAKAVEAYATAKAETLRTQKIHAALKEKNKEGAAEREKLLSKTGEIEALQAKGQGINQAQQAEEAFKVADAQYQAAAQIHSEAYSAARAAVFAADPVKKAAERELTCIPWYKEEWSTQIDPNASEAERKLAASMDIFAACELAKRALHRLNAANNSNVVLEFTAIDTLQRALGEMMLAVAEERQSRSLVAEMVAQAQNMHEALALLIAREKELDLPLPLQYSVVNILHKNVFAPFKARLEAQIVEQKAKGFLTVEEDSLLQEVSRAESLCSDFIAQQYPREPIQEEKAEEEKSLKQLNREAQALIEIKTSLRTKLQSLEEEYKAIVTSATSLGDQCPSRDSVVDLVVHEGHTLQEEVKVLEKLLEMHSKMQALMEGEEVHSVPKEYSAVQLFSAALKVLREKITAQAEGAPMPSSPEETVACLEAGMSEEDILKRMKKPVCVKELLAHIQAAEQACSDFMEKRPSRESTEVCSKGASPIEQLLSPVQSLIGENQRLLDSLAEPHNAYKQAVTSLHALGYLQEQEYSAHHGAFNKKKIDVLTGVLAGLREKEGKLVSYQAGSRGPGFESICRSVEDKKREMQKAALQAQEDALQARIDAREDFFLPSGEAKDAKSEAQKNGVRKTPPSSPSRSRASFSHHDEGRAAAQASQSSSGSGMEFDPDAEVGAAVEYEKMLADL